MGSLFFVGAGVTLLYLLAALYLFVKFIRGDNKAAIRRRLAALAADPDDDPLDIEKRHRLSSISWLHVLLERVRWARKLDRMLMQAAIRAPLGLFLILAATLGLGGWWASELLLHNPIVKGGLALVLASMPFVWIKYKRDSRIATFEAQLPDALDLVCRALKSGHTFGSGMGLVAQEFDEPIRSEFNKALDEINFGINVRDALMGLAGRLDSPDLDFFVISVNIQTETGGNLSEIIENITTLIRERFKLKGNVRTLSAEGRMAAMILVALPFFVGGFVKLTNPDYLSVLFEDPLGRLMLYGATVQMLFGMAIIKKMVAIKV